jgi:hypothetical protein
MEGMWGVYAALGGFALVVAIAILWPFRKKKGVP